MGIRVGHLMLILAMVGFLVGCTIAFADKQFDRCHRWGPDRDPRNPERGGPWDPDSQTLYFDLTCYQNR